MREQQNLERFNNERRMNSQMSQQVEMHNRPRQTIVVSDLHGNINKWIYVLDALRRNPNLKVIIEGDAMDRGPYGLQMLMQIKELSDRGRVEYIPGNHDAFAFNYLRTQGTRFENSRVAQIAEKMWEHNGGKVTKENFKNFNRIMENEIRLGNITKKMTKQELVLWLGSRPVQKRIIENGTQYALGHAVFDEELYKIDPNFNLHKALIMELEGRQNSIIFKKYMNLMWYREDDPKTHYTNINFPKNHIMLVGHTKQKEPNVKYLNNDPTKPIVYLDCGKGVLQGFNLSTRSYVQLEPKQLER